MSGSITVWSQSAQMNTGSPTPQFLCRERHQSGRAAIMFFILSYPHEGASDGVHHGQHPVLQTGMVQIQEELLRGPEDQGRLAPPAVG
jgi:hypothetical protein